MNENCKGKVRLSLSKYKKKKEFRNFFSKLFKKTQITVQFVFIRNTVICETFKNYNLTQL